MSCYRARQGNKYSYFTLSQQLKSYLDEGQLSLNNEGALVPTSTDLPLPTPGTPLTPHTSTYAHYLQSQNEPVSTHSTSSHKLPLVLAVTIPAYTFKTSGPSVSKV